MDTVGRRALAVKVRRPRAARFDTACGLLSMHVAVAPRHGCGNMVEALTTKPPSHDQREKGLTSSPPAGRISK